MTSADSERSILEGVSSATVTRLLSAALSCGGVVWPEDANQELNQKVIAAIRQHGIAALLHSRSSDLVNWPAQVLEFLRDSARASAVWELRHCQHLKQLLTSFDQAGVRPLLLKGTALAYWLYDHPSLRMRGDSDVLVAPNARKKAVSIFLDHSYSPVIQSDRITLITQATFERRMANGERHHFDLHWKINNSTLLAQLFNFDELAGLAQPLPTLHPYAQGLGPVHAMLIACMHRSVHASIPIYVDGHPRRMTERLVWLWDIHLLAGQLDERGWEHLVALATQKGLCGSSYNGLTASRSRFGTEIPETVIKALRITGEKSSTYLNAGAAKRLWLDFLAIDGAWNKARFLRELAFPTSNYLRHKYPHAQCDWLPLLYLRHAVDGIRKRIAGP